MHVYMFRYTVVRQFCREKAINSKHNKLRKAVFVLAVTRIR